MLKEYYYDKHSIIVSWNTDPRGATGSKELFSRQTEKVDWIGDGYDTSGYDKEFFDDWFCIYSGPIEEGTTATCSPVDVYIYQHTWTISGFTDYELVNLPFNGMPNYHYKMTGFKENYAPKYKAHDFHYQDLWDYYNLAYGRYYTYRAQIEGKMVGRILKTYGEGYGGAWDDKSWMNMKIESIVRLLPYTAYQHKARGTLLEEDLIRNETYPKDGVKDGFWWVRGREYTIPAPTLLEPENAFLVNVPEGDTFPELVFRLNKRHATDSNDLKYHARVQLGFESDFVNPIQQHFSKDDQTNWFYKDSAGSWQAFPATGVPGGTEVKYVPTIAELQFGFYYWNATAWHSFWRFGIEANARMIIVITDTDELYYLVVNGKPYKALSLDLQESSNGEIGNINIGLFNKS